MSPRYPQTLHNLSPSLLERAALETSAGLEGLKQKWNLSHFVMVGSNSPVLVTEWLKFQIYLSLLPASGQPQLFQNIAPHQRCDFGALRPGLKLWSVGGGSSFVPLHEVAFAANGKRRCSRDSGDRTESPRISCSFGAPRRRSRSLRPVNRRSVLEGRGIGDQFSS